MLLSSEFDVDARRSVRDQPSPVVTNALPYVVRVVRTEEQLQKVCELRALSYGRYVPELGKSLARPEPDDRLPGTVILLAQDKTSGEAIGTLKINLNLYDPLPVQSAIELPAALMPHLLAELSRFSIRPDSRSMSVRLGLFKATYLYCYANQVRHLLVGAKNPLDKIYRELGFAPIDSEERWVPLAYAGNIEHIILIFDVLVAERRWHGMQHPLYEFMGHTYHPDIQVFAAVSSGWTTPRRADRSGVS